MAHFTAGWIFHSFILYLLSYYIIYIAEILVTLWCMAVFTSSCEDVWVTFSGNVDTTNCWRVHVPRMMSNRHWLESYAIKKSAEYSDVSGHQFMVNSVGILANWRATIMVPADVDNVENV